MRAQPTASFARTLPRKLAVWIAPLALAACDDGAPTAPIWMPAPPPVDAATPPSAAGMTGSSNIAGTTGAAGTLPEPMPAPPAPIEDARMPDVTLMDAAVHTDDEDAGPWVPPEPSCVDDRWQLAPGFLVSRRVDYVADRVAVPKATSTTSTEKPELISSAGTPCATAKDRPKCESALALPVPFGRHLVSTSGDDVKVWHMFQGRALLGLIDTTAEALWWLEMNSQFRALCDSTVTVVPGGYVVDGVDYNFICDPAFADASTPQMPARSKVFIGADGTLTVIQQAPITAIPPNCTTAPFSMPFSTPF